MALQINTPYSVRLGVVGAGTMGSGIALAALQAGMLVTLFDVEQEMLDRARGYVEKHLERKGQTSRMKNLTLTPVFDDLSKARVVIEAIPEDLALKTAVFERLDEICPPPAVLATNTSTLAVTAIAAATATPGRVAGMHFFNPAPVLPLVEVVRGAQTTPETVQALVSLAGLLGKTPVVARDTPGFIVNRVARPFYGEALRLLGEGTATHAEIDRVVRLGGGFRMGPFQLMDLIGIDINFAAMQSMWEQTFGEPRYRPHPIQVQMVQQRALGRKTGRGFYTYDPEPPADPQPPRPKRQSGVILQTAGTWTPGLLELCGDAGYDLRPTESFPAGTAASAFEGVTAGIVAAGRGEGVRQKLLELDQDLPPGVPLLCQCAGITLNEAMAWVRHPERLVGFDGLFFANGPAATLVAGPQLDPAVRQSVEGFVRGLGRLPHWVEDSPGLILPRIVSMLSNEAAFAVGERVAEADTIDLAMRLGTNYPHGPLEWARQIGYGRIVAVLDHLRDEYGEERYRTAPLLRRWARQE